LVYKAIMSDINANHTCEPAIL